MARLSDMLSAYHDVRLRPVWSADPLGMSLWRTAFAEEPSCHGGR